MICFRRKHKKMEKMMTDIADDVKTLLGLAGTMQGTLKSISDAVNAANQTVASQPNNTDVATITSGLTAVQTQLTNGFAAIQATLSQVAAALVPTAGLATTATATDASVVQAAGADQASTSPAVAS